MLVRLIQRLYTYITNILSPYLNFGASKCIDDDDDDETDHKERHDDEETRDDYIDQKFNRSTNILLTNKHNPYDSAYEYDESYDMVYDMDRSLYRDFYKQKMKYNRISTSTPTLKKSQSYVIPNNYYCGYCSKHIRVPQHMYYNKTYCSIYCRNNQIQLDELGSTQIREHHSFSM
jgi:hypothetical protein